MTSIRSLVVFALCSSAVMAAETAGQVFDRQLKSTEREFVSLVEAMPADKFGFAPTNGAFKDVRTFARKRSTWLS